jgi:hypothetical protein
MVVDWWCDTEQIARVRPRLLEFAELTLDIHGDVIL